MYQDTSPAQHGIVVRNTFIDIDVQQPRDGSDEEDVAPGSRSPHRRNLSAPPSPTRVRRSADVWGEDGAPGDPEGPGSNFRLDGESTLFSQGVPGLANQFGNSNWPDQYIEDQPAAGQLWQDASRLGGAESALGASRIPPVPDQPHHLRGRDPHSFGGFDPYGVMGGKGSELGYMMGSEMDFAYARGFGSGLDAGALLPPGRGLPGAYGLAPYPGLHPDMALGGMPGAVVGGRSQGRGAGAPGSKGGGRGRGRGGGDANYDGYHGLGVLGGFGQNIWSSDASNRWPGGPGQLGAFGAPMAEDPHHRPGRRNSRDLASAKGKGRENNKGGGKKDDGAAVGGKVPLSGGGPKRTDYQKKYGNETQDSVPITTMMLKNIPCRKSQEDVMKEVDDKGFGGTYDFFYLPRDVKFRASLGYAFVNFNTPEDAANFQAEMNGYKFVNSGSSKACQVVPAHVQGLQNNLAAFKRTEVMRSTRKPFFLAEGKSM